MTPQFAIAQHIIEKFPGCHHHITRHNGDTGNWGEDDAAVISVHVKTYAFYVWRDTISIRDWSQPTGINAQSRFASLEPLKADRLSFDFCDPAFVDFIDELLEVLKCKQ